MRRNSFNICITLILCVCIIFSYSTISFAMPNPWDSTTLQILYDKIDNVNNTASSIYTALSTLYSYLYNNSNGVRELLSYIYTRLGSVTSTLDYYAPRTDTYQNNVWTTINNATYGLLAQGIHLLNIDNDLDTINNSVLAVGGQVADVSSKLLNANNYLYSIDSKFTTNNNSLSSIDTKLTNINNGITLENVNLSNIHTEAFNTNTKLDTVLSRLSNIDSDTDNIEQILTDIYDSLYFTDIIEIKNYYDQYYAQGLKNYPYTASTGNTGEIASAPTKFVIDSDVAIVGNEFDVYIPWDFVSVNVGQYTNQYIYTVASDTVSTSGTACGRYDLTVSYVDNIICLHFKINRFYNSILDFIYFGIPISQIFNNLDPYTSYTYNSPYLLISDSSTKSYFELWQELYGNETFKNYLLSLDNDQIEIILNDIYDHLDQSQVESLLSDIYVKLDESTSIVSTDTDINIEVDLDLDTGSGITGVVNKLKQLYNTGINITSFVTALNFFDNLGWFTDLQDRDLVNSVNSSYIDLYD